MKIRRGWVVLGFLAIFTLLAAKAPASADVSGPGAAYGTVGDCPSGVGAFALAPTLSPPVALPRIAYGAELGTDAVSCASSHTNLYVVAELYLLPHDGSDTSGVLVDQTFAQCRPPNGCSNAVATGSFAVLPVVGLYRVVGRFSVSTPQGYVTGVLVGPTFIYTGLSLVAAPSLP